MPALTGIEDSPSGSLTGTGFRRMVASETLSLTADRLLGVALPLFVLDRTGSGGLAAAAVLSQALPLAVFGALGGAIVDRVDHRRALVVASATRWALALPMLLVVLRVLPLPVVFVLAAVLVTIGQVTGPAVGASLPSLIPKSDLPRAIAQMSARNVVVQLVAPTLGALLYGWAGLGAVITVDAGLFAAATFGFYSLPRRPSAPARASTVSRDMVEGVRRVRRDPVLTWLLAAVGLGLVGLSLELAVLVPFVRGVLHGAPETVGLLTSTEAVGGLLAAALFPALHRRLGLQRMLSLGVIGLPAATLGLLASQSTVQAVPGLLLAGLLLTLLTAAVRVHVQSSVEPGYLGRVAGVIGSVIGAAAVLGSLLAIGLMALIGLRWCLAVAACIEVTGTALHLSARAATREDHMH